MKFKNNVRIVWNLTNLCPYNCPMCVASANKRKEISVNKDKILESILSVDKDILSIDFSGGDPLFKENDIAIIKKASNILGKDKISISSTGLSISKLSDNDLLSLASGYDITYDFPKKYKEYDIRDKRYNELNYEQGIRLKRLGLDLNVFIPMRNLESHYYKELASDILELNPKTIGLLKCMPLNNNFDTNKFENIINVKNFKKALKSIRYKGKVTINCALKEDFKIKNNCDMLTSIKIGLDQFGNLYTCIWASDILEEKGKSPFYLGNLLTDNLATILSSDMVTKCKLKLKNNRNKCHVLEHFYEVKKSSDYKE